MRKRKRWAPPAIRPLNVRAADGQSLGTVLPPKATPSDLEPGELLIMPWEQQPSRTFIYSDKMRFWTGTTWEMSGTFTLLPIGATEAEIAELRRKILKREGWTD